LQNSLLFSLLAGNFRPETGSPETASSSAKDQPHRLGLLRDDDQLAIQPTRVWRVLGANIAASRFEAMRPAALTPLVGRDEEIELLVRRWERAKAGAGQIVLVAGEPGIGKSRVTAALEERLKAEPHLRLRY
jgi:hypothetical protein